MDMPLVPVRFSHLKLMALSPAHYLAATVKETPAIERGRALHSIILGGQRVTYYEGKVRRGKDYDLFCRENKDAQVLTRRDFDAVNGMAEAVFANKRAMEVLQGQHELEVDWQYLGRACQSHIDCLGPGGEYVTELKSTMSSSPEKFSYQAARMGYFAQVAFYRQAVLEARLGTPRTVYFVAIEQAPPHVVSVFEATPHALESGDKAVRAWFERLLGCEAANDWPGYVQDIVPLDTPNEGIEITYGDGGGEEEPAHDPVTGEVAA
jgi:hypothetical protein